MKIRPKKALISVSNKEGIVSFARELSKMGIELISTGGTAKLLSENGLDIEEISEFTGFPEILGGRVKTLNPKVHAGILNKRENSTHKETMESLNLENIDMVVVNLYPFEETISSEDVSISEAVENIDIGGPTMIRSAAKNFKYVASVVDRSDYRNIAGELLSSGGLSLDTRIDLARKAFTHTALYDSLISNYFNGLLGVGFPDEFAIPVRKKQNLRYGENPHQKSSFYISAGSNCETGISNAVQLHGKELSFNNIIDANAAIEIVKEFHSPACAVVKHTNPSGVALGNNITDAFMSALECDSVSAFGGIVAVNRVLDRATAAELTRIFLEVIIAPGFEADALEILKEKKNVRLMEVRGDLFKRFSEFDVKKVTGGYLFQERDLKTFYDNSRLKSVTMRTPDESEYSDILFAWSVAKHVKSNAIVYVKDEKTIGIGAGQMSRVDSSRVAAEKSNTSLEGAVMASDAFFPFRDSVDEAAERGVKAIVQPGGSVRDEEVIRAADENNIAMVFTGMRHFKH